MGPPSARSPLVMRRMVTGLLLGAVLWPLRPGASDGFPLSTYPMFAEARPPISRVETVLGIRDDGRPVVLTPWHVGGTRRAKFALANTRREIARSHARPLCRAVAERVRESPLEGEPIVEIEVVTETWSTLSSTVPDARRVHARCEVPR